MKKMETGLSRIIHMSIENLRNIRKPGIWVYCQGCKRCYLTGEEREEDDMLWCAYADCKLDCDIYDAVEWTVILKHYPDFPKQPERNIRYLPF